MKVYLLLAAMAMALTILLTPAVRWACLRFHILPPVRGRDVQKTPIPRLGGVAMTIALIVTMLVASRIPYMAPLFTTTVPWAVMAGAGAMCVLGVIDDIIELDWMAKLGGQVLIAGGMAFGGVQLASFPIFGITLGSSRLWLFISRPVHRRHHERRQLHRWTRRPGLRHDRNRCRILLHLLVRHHAPHGGLPPARDNREPHRYCSRRSMRGLPLVQLPPVLDHDGWGSRRAMGLVLAAVGIIVTGKIDPSLLRLIRNTIESRTDSSLAEAKSSFASVNWDTLKSSITEDAKEQSKTAATDAVQSTIDQIVSETASDSELSEESKNAVNDKMSQLKNEINDTIASAIDQNLDLSSSTTDIDQLKSATEGTLNSLTELIASCHTTLDQMSSGAGSFAEAMQSLSSLSETLKTLQNSLSALSAGSLQLTQGLTSFQQGISQLSEGSSTLSQGATKLGTAGKELKEGYTTLAEGISSISEGLTLFDKEGIQELEKLGGDDLKNLSKRMKAVKEADAEYDNYGGKLEEQTGEVRFIIETDGID